MHFGNRFYGHATRKRLRPLNEDRKVELLNTHLFGQLAFRGTVWPPTRKTYEGVDALQRKMLLGLLQISRLEAETDAAYYARRHNIASTIANRTTRWSDRLLVRAHNWQGHLLRAHVPSPATAQAALKHEVTLERMRFNYIELNGTQGDTISVTAGRFGTRQFRGRPPMRWAEGLKRSEERCKQVLESIKDKRKCRAKTLKSLETKKFKTQQAS